MDDLDAIVAKAFSMGFKQFCLTEHMPRLDDKYLYPEETSKAYTTVTLSEVFENYYIHAKQLRKQYEGSGMEILVGFEVEGTDIEHLELAKRYMPRFDMCVGSVHFLHGFPIDFSQDLWLKAKDATNGKSSRSLFLDYFQLQYKVIDLLHPQVIGHFDLIRLFQPPHESKDLKQWPDVYQQIITNIKLVNSYNGLFELNSAALRKGWDSPYPQPDLVQLILELGGKFCLSDDSHGLNQIGLNYHKVWKYVNQMSISSIYCLSRNGIIEEKVSNLTQSSFWLQYESPLT